MIASNNNDIKAYEEILASGQNGLIPEIKASAHPFVILFHFLFKAMPITLYLLYTPVKLLVSEIFLNQLIVGLIVIDFWYTKNVSGRLLVGLRWWLDEDEQEIERLKVQCRVNQQEQSQSISSKVFWVVQVAYIITALVFLIISLFMFSFSSAVLVGGMFVEGIINLYCFIRCSKIQTDKLRKLQQKLGIDFTKKLFGGSLIAFT